MEVSSLSKLEVRPIHHGSYAPSGAGASPVHRTFMRDGGGTLSASEVVDLRRAIQRMMCLAGTMYPESTCHLM